MGVGNSHSKPVTAAKKPTPSAVGILTRLALGILFAAGVFSTFTATMNRELTSDFVQQAMYFHDLVTSHNYLLSGWCLPANSYLFTDFPFYCISGLMFSLNDAAIKMTAFIVVMTAFLLLFLLLWREHDKTVAAVCLVVLLNGSLFAHLCLSVPYGHLGTVVFSLLCLILTTLLHKSQAGEHSSTGLARIILIIIFFLSALSTFSDIYFLFSFILPLLAALLVMERSGKPFLSRRGYFFLIVTVTSGFFAGLILQNMAPLWNLTLVKHSWRIAMPDQLTSNFILLGRALCEFCNASFLSPSPDVMSSFIRILNFAILLISILMLVLALKKEGNIKRLFILMFFISSSFLISLAYLITTLPSGTETARYLFPVLFTLSIGTALVFDAAVSPFRGLLKTLFIAALALSCIANFNQALNYRSVQSHREIAHFLVEKGLTYGYASHWHANIITFLSNYSVSVRPVTIRNRLIRPLRFMSRREWYVPSCHTGPSFLLVPKEGDIALETGIVNLPENYLNRTFGPPEKKITFQNYDIYLWPYNIMREVYGLDLKETVEISEQSRHETGTVIKEDDHYVLKAARGEKGALYICQTQAFEQGDYRVRFFIMATSPANEKAQAAELTLSIWNEEKKELCSSPVKASVMAGVEKKWQELILDFKALPNPYGFLLYDLRLDTSGRGEVKLKKIIIEKYEKSKS